MVCFWWLNNTVLCKTFYAWSIHCQPGKEKDCRDGPGAPIQYTCMHKTYWRVNSPSKCMAIGSYVSMSHLCRGTSVTCLLATTLASMCFREGHIKKQTTIEGSKAYCPELTPDISYGLVRLPAKLHRWGIP